MTPPHTLLEEYQQKERTTHNVREQLALALRIADQLKSLLTLPSAERTAPLEHIKKQLATLFGDVHIHHLIDSSEEGSDSLHNTVTHELLRTIDLPLLQTIVWDQIHKLQSKLTGHAKRAADYLEAYIEPLHKLRDAQLDTRAQQSSISFLPVRHHFPERKQEAIRWNSPFDIFQGAFVDPTDYMHINRSDHQLDHPLSQEEKTRLMKQAIIFAPTNIERIPVETRHKLGRFLHLTTHKQLLQKIHPAQLEKELTYFKQVCARTDALERLGKKPTWRVQLCQHPDHVGKIFVYRVITSPHPDGKKMPYKRWVMSVYDDIYSFIRSQHHALGHTGDDLEQWDVLLHTLHTLRLNIRDKHSLPSHDTIIKLIDVLSSKQNHHLARICDTHLRHLLRETHPERARNILWGAENALLQRISDQEHISQHVHEQKQHLKRVRDFAEINWTRFGSARRTYLKHHSDTKRDNLKPLVSTYLAHPIGAHLPPFQQFSRTIQELVSLPTTPETESKLIQAIDTLLALQSLIRVALRWHHQRRQHPITFPVFPYQAWLAGTQGYLHDRYGETCADILVPVQHLLEQIDLLITYPTHLTEDELLHHEDIDQYFLTDRKKAHAIGATLRKIQRIDLLPTIKHTILQ